MTLVVLLFAAASEPQNTAPTGKPTISGIPHVGQTLTASTSGIDDATGLTNSGYTCQCIRVSGGSAANLSGAVDSTCTLVAAGPAHRVCMRVSFTDDGGYAAPLTSDYPPGGSVLNRPGAPSTFERAGRHRSSTGTATAAPVTAGLPRGATAIGSGRWWTAPCGA